MCRMRLVTPAWRREAPRALRQEDLESGCWREGATGQDAQPGGYLLEPDPAEDPKPKVEPPAGKGNDPRCLKPGRCP